LAIRCLIVDDNAQFLEAARSLLEGEGISVVGMASTSADALRQAGRLQPDVALVDIDLGEESGFDLVRLLTDEAGLGQLRVILISTYAERDFADLIAAGPAAGFVSKSDLSLRAIRAVLRSTAGEQRADAR
jgi:DNA-binding NarL/FixJ family response regulator